MTIVIGTGPAGLTAAYLLAKKGERVTLVERSVAPGGLWRGFNYNLNLYPIVDRQVPPGVPANVHFETGMHWYTDCGVPEIDAFWRGLPVERVEIPREIAGCYWDGQLQINSPYPDVRGGKTFSNRPVLEKLWGVPLEDLADGADRLIKIDRVVAFDEESTRVKYEGSPESRRHIAWPDQRSLPHEYRSNRSSFYPVRGMRTLVSAALKQLTYGLGVQVVIGKDWAHWEDRIHHEPTIWAAGIKGLADALQMPWPTGMTKPRPLTIVNVLLPNETPPHDLHYAFDYDPGSLFRQTWYRNFVPQRWNLMSLEILGDNVEWAHPSNPGSTVLGIHSLGPTLPVPTKRNEVMLEELRAQLATWRPNITMVGAGAKAGLFFQPEVLKHVAEVCA